ncbi:MAG: hypothetical protein V3S46_00535 [Nitrospinota bacterium]
MNARISILVIAFAFVAGVAVSGLVIYSQTYPQTHVGDAGIYKEQIRKLEKRTASFKIREKEFEINNAELLKAQIEVEKNAAKLQKELESIQNRRALIQKKLNAIGKERNEKYFTKSVDERDLLRRLDALLGGAGPKPISKPNARKGTVG